MCAGGGGTGQLRLLLLLVVAMLPAGIVAHGQAALTRFEAVILILLDGRQGECNGAECDAIMRNERVNQKRKEQTNKL